MQRRQWRQTTSVGISGVRASEFVVILSVLYTDINLTLGHATENINWSHPMKGDCGMSTEDGRTSPNVKYQVLCYITPHKTLLSDIWMCHACLAIKTLFFFGHTLKFKKSQQT